MFKEKTPETATETKLEGQIERRPDDLVTCYVLVRVESLPNQRKLILSRILSGLYHWYDNEKAVDVTEKLSQGELERLMGE